MAESAGFPADAIVGALAPRSRSDPRKTLPRWQKQTWHPSALALVQRDSEARQAAAYAVKDLRRADDRLRTAQKTAGVRMPGCVGENAKSQRALMKRSRPAAVEWIAAEIEFLELLREAATAERAAGVYTLPASFHPPEALDAEIRRRISELRKLLGESRFRLTVAYT